MAFYQDTFKGHPYQSAKASYPMLQKVVFDALAALTPTQLQFEIDCHKRAGTEISINWYMIDSETYLTIGNLVSGLIDTPGLILTQHDLYLSWLRVKELIYTRGLLEQGIVKEHFAADGSVVYVSEEPPAPETKVDNRKKYWARLKKPVDVPGDEMPQTEV